MWQPIETAPRNQTFLAVLDCAGEQTICTMRWPVAEAKNSRPDSKTFRVERVTHWMPLPDLPGAQAQPAPAQSTKDDIISDLQPQFDTEGITEYDSGDALIRLSDAIAAVEDNFALAQPAPKAVAYLDLGTGGYMDIGTDLTDEELATLPKGRHMLGVIGTYGVDGYVPAQPAPRVPTALLVAAADMVAQMEIASRVGFVDTPNDKDSCAAFCMAEGTWLELMSAVESLASALAAAPEAKP